MLLLTFFPKQNIFYWFYEPAHQLMNVLLYSTPFKPTNCFDISVCEGIVC